MALRLASALALLAFLLVLAINQSPYLPAPHPDAASYVGAAASLAERGRLEVPIADWSDPDAEPPLAHFPPGFPAALALPAALGLPLGDAAVLVLALSAAAAAAALVLLVARAAGWGFGLLAALLPATTFVLVSLYTAIWSEPLFLALMVPALHALAFRPERPLRFGILAGLAALVRYVGVALTITRAMWVWRRAPSPSARARAVLQAAGPTVLLLGGWSLATRAQGGVVRRVGVYGRLDQSLRELPEALRLWLFPWAGGAPGLAAALVLGVAVSLVILAGARRLRAARGAGDDAPPRVLGVLGLTALCYALLVLVTRLWADPLTPFDARMLAPIILIGEVAALIALAALWPALRGPGRVIAGLSIAAWAAASLYHSASAVSAWRRDGAMYTAPQWRGSAAIAWTRAAGRGHTLYSNEPAALFFLAGRTARTLPAQLDSATARAFRDRFIQGNGALVLFPWTFARDPRLPPVHRVLPVEPVVFGPEGSVFTLRTPEP